LKKLVLLSFILGSLFTLRAYCQDKVLMVVPKKDFRDEELFVSKEIIEHSGYGVDIASSSPGYCFGMLGHNIEATMSLDDIKVADYKAVIFIGGVGAKEYWHDNRALSIARDAMKEEIVLAAICIAPVTLANAGVLEGRGATVSALFKDQIIAKGAIYSGSGIEVDVNIITASSPSSSEGFGCKIVELLKDR